MLLSVLLWVTPAWSFHLQEATIADVHSAITSGELTCTKLVTLYLNRIKAYSNAQACVIGAVDADGLMLDAITPMATSNGQLNAFSTLNLRPAHREAMGFSARLARTQTPQGSDPNDASPDLPDALDAAAQLDTQFAATRQLSGPLHCIPFAVKDSMDTREMRTTNGLAVSFANDRPSVDATYVARLRQAGAILMGKSNTDDMQTGNQGRSSYGGQTCNPYDHRRVPGGSSGGSAVAVSANLVMCATAEETWGSVRNPASNNSIVGLLPTRGITSTYGIWPNSYTRDRAGVHCRTVLDTAKVLDAIKGVDVKDTTTGLSDRQIPSQPYASFAQNGSVKGMRLGVISEFMNQFTPENRASITLMNQAIADLRNAGATVVLVNFEDVIADLLPRTNPGYLQANFPWAYPTGVDPIDQEVTWVVDHSTFPQGLFGANLRRLQPLYFFQNEIKSGINKYLRLRNDANIKTFDGILKDPKMIHDAEYDQRFCDKQRVLGWGGHCDGQTPAHFNSVNGTGPVNDGTQLDPFGVTQEMQERRNTLRSALSKVMADNQLDALIYPFKNHPANAITGLPSEVVDFENALGPFNDWAGGWNGLGPIAGFPDIVVPMGFSDDVWNIVAVDGRTEQPFTPNTRDSLAKGYFFFANVHEDTSGVAPLPYAIDFMVRPFDEATLFKIAAGYEAATRRRVAPSRFGRLPGEP
jgi:Asp-tRNA(Asn)/Glu-tRNA(Gln) amidotransferase A subunit family amidase